MNTATSTSIRIRSRERTLVHTRSFSLSPNGITFLFGESGIGKSLLAQALYGLLDPRELDVTMGTLPYARYRRLPHVQEWMRHGFFVFQEPSSHLNPLMKLSDQLREGSLSKSTVIDQVLNYFWNGTPREQLATVVDIYPKPFRPSGGEKQRVLLAMAFAKIELLRHAPPQAEGLFVFDEPTGSLDNSYRDLFLKALVAAHTLRPFTALVITHDYSIISMLEKTFPRQRTITHLRELYRTSAGGVDLRTFEPREYLSWLERARCTDETGAEVSRRPVLEMDPHFEALGRRYTICRDPGCTHPAPLRIHPAGMIYLKAPSGVGKTTLSKAVLGLLPARRLQLTLDGMALSHATPLRVWRSRIWGRKAGMVFQHADEALNPQSTVRESFAGLPCSMTKRELVRHLGQLFDAEALGPILDKKITFLSGGQKQRLNILRTLAANTPLVILDEPLNGLDFTSVKRVLALLEQKRREGAALLMISHNEEIFDALTGAQGKRYLGYAS